MDKPREAELLVLIGIGGSAGSLQALFEFFAALPRIRGATFVIVVHQDPRLRTRIPELLRRRTTYPVLLIEAGTKIEPERIYVAPPAATVGIEHGTFTLTPFASWRERARRIDAFFRAAAASFGRRAVAIVLSGGGTDGSEGIRAIAAESGLTMAQAPASAQHRSMPEAAIATGAVKHVMPPAHLPAVLVSELQPAAADGAVAEYEYTVA
ncbi:MAG TPA: chemotaxis protein CheB [Polyangiales bacterium]|nr:chemotaxis protein CheB [Polyangiales bacterium]